MPRRADRRKKRITIPIAILFVVYFIAIVEQNNIVGDLLSPILTFLAFAPVFYAFFWKDQHKLLKISGLFYALAIFAWFLCDFSWGFSTLIFNFKCKSRKQSFNYVWVFPYESFFTAFFDIIRVLPS